MDTNLTLSDTALTVTVNGAHDSGRPAAVGDTPQAPRVSRATAARLAGLGYVLIFALAIFANFFVREGLVEAGDATATTANISESLGLFRWGLVAFLAVFILDVAIAWALHIVFRTTNRDVSLVAAWARLVYTVFLGAALVYWFDILRLLSGADYLSALGRPQIEAQVMLALDSFDTMWLVGLAAFGVHLSLLGGLAIHSRMLPRALGVLLIAAGLAYVADTVAHALLADYDSVENLFLALVAIPSIIGEGWFGLWLLTRAQRLTDPN